MNKIPLFKYHIDSSKHLLFEGSTKKKEVFI